MTRKPILWLMALGLAAAPAGTASAQGMMQDGMMHGGMMHGGMMQGVDRGTNGQAPGSPDDAKSNEGMHCMMQGGMRAGMGDPRMSSMMGSGTMHGATPGASALFGERVRPVMNLSVDDVRGYLAMRLERLNNKRLKVGDVKSDDATITADIVTVDNSLVQRLKVDRHTGAITYES